ncbi:MAG TPA: head-tail connector protein [Telluria sp.]|nr:head-tail connector protein [Telluria sp.]
MSSLVTLDQAKAQGRITWTSEDTLLQSYIDAAERYAMAFLNRNVYADDTALAAAVADAPAALATAKAAYDAAYAAWQLMDAGDLADIALEKLNQDWTVAKTAARRTYFGMVVNATFVQAIVLLVAGWAVNREFVITELSDAIELPMGFTALLWNDRVRQGV